MTDKSASLLAEHREPFCVSVYATTAAGSEVIEQKRASLRYQLTELCGRLSLLGVDGPTARALLKPAWRLVKADDFWKHTAQHTAPGLALFLSRQRTSVFLLSWAPAARSLIGPRFHIDPLLERESNAYRRADPDVLSSSGGARAR